MEVFTDSKVVGHPDELDDHGILIVHGGADISPALYNKACSPRTGADAHPSRRDKIEWELMQEAVKRGIPILGICRGAQMLCALSGGFLIQDVTGHCGYHKVICNDGTEFNTNSMHHQMMYPFDVRHELVARTEHKLSKHYDDANVMIDVESEPEFVYFPETKGIAVQWHPEVMSGDSAANIYLKNYVAARL